MEHIIFKQNKHLSSLINEVSQLTKAEFDAFLLQMQKIKIENYSNVSSKKEADLLIEINKGLPIKQQKQYDKLLAKRLDETLTESEYSDLLKLTEKKEALQERRLASMIELAKLRNITLPKLAEQLELKADLYVA